MLKYFFDCYFNQSFGFDFLERKIGDFKKEAISTQQQFVKELEVIIQKEDYFFVSDFINKQSDFSLNCKETEKFINYLYDKFLDRSTKVKATDFIKKYKVIFCPACTQDPKLKDMPKIIYKATVIEKNIDIYMCKLCRLVWLDKDDIQANNGQNYKEFMKANGLKGWWKELKDVDFL